MTLQLISRPAPVGTETETPSAQTSAFGGAWLGEPTTAGAPSWPVQRIPAPVLGGVTRAVEETWLAGSALVSGNSEGIAWSRSGNVLFGVIELDDRDFPAPSGETPLQSASAEAYRRIFRLLAAQQLPHLWRVWNYLADINIETGGLERYRQFNIGRQDAFLACQRGATGNVPAACAIGLASGPLSIAFMAGDRPAVPVENPRQVSAYHYPSEYGPRSPTFSRGALVYPPGQEILFISGTASIVGHRTMHLGDVVGQCRESLANVSAVVEEANRQARSPAFALRELAYRVYVRHVADFPAVRATLAESVGDAEIVYVQADICRADLLLEIEAMASHPLECS